MVQNLEADWYFEGPEFRGGLARNLEADWYFEGPEFRGGLVWNSSLKRATVFQRSRTRSGLKMDPTSRQT
ncbi:hypothetical protein RCL_jg10411.t1 [Rhizophagus clarus]|uniref:Uncharacterized protein n=1 Tax=Rhizophagus clarus TaxID=94130 RepID=A0A8H3QF94_9GLOM|nr:hypothetical protein RCL_jg10411.t1 [Rhizophagus clarus]